MLFSGLLENVFVLIIKFSTPVFNGQTQVIPLCVSLRGSSLGWNFFMWQPIRCILLFCFCSVWPNRAQVWSPWSYLSLIASSRPLAAGHLHFQHLSGFAPSLIPFVFFHSQQHEHILVSAFFLYVCGQSFFFFSIYVNWYNSPKFFKA